MANFLLDDSRYTSHERLLNPDGTPVLRRDRSYITLWDYWNQPDDEFGENDRVPCERMSALHAYRKKLITEEEYFHMMAFVRDKLMRVSVEDLNLTSSHFLICIDSEGCLIKNDQGEPGIRICYFELLKRFQ